MKQRNNEPVSDYIQRFRDIRSMCFSLFLTDGLLAELDFKGMLPHIWERFASHEFESLSHLAQRLACVDVRPPTSMKTTYQKRVNFAGDSSDSEDEAEIGLVEWIKKKELISCPFAKKEKERYGFDITKADRIFDLELQEGQVKLKNRKYCKWHNAISHSTYECRCSARRSNRLSKLEESSSMRLRSQ